MSEVGFQPGTKYKVLYKSETQKVSREAVMVFMSATETEYVFSARPAAGTQPLPKSWLVDWALAPAGAECYVGKVRRK